MKNNIFKNSVIPMLLVCILMLLSSQAVLAARKLPPPVVVIDSVVVDYNNNKVVVTGAEFTTISNVSLGVIDVSGDTTKNSNENLEIAFGENMALAVPIPGNYSLSLDGNTFSVYFNSAVINPNVTATCPCQAEWDFFNIAPPGGFLGLTPSITNTGEEVMALMQYTDTSDTYIWWLGTQFTNDVQKCELYVDGSALPLTSWEQHVACSNYLKALPSSP